MIGARFQSAPLTDVRGDSHDRRTDTDQYPFQSAPLTDVRGDGTVDVYVNGQIKFQSAPLTDVRGDRRRRLAPCGWPLVSIRSPH